MSDPFPSAQRRSIPWSPVLVACLLWFGTWAAAGAPPLTTLKYRLASTELRVSPAMVSVPKGIAGSVLVQVLTQDGATNAVTESVAAGAYVEAILRGPSLEPRRVIGQANAALTLPPLSLVGDYRLDNVRLVDAATGATRLEGVPSSVSVHVFDEVLVSRVTSRPLTYDEIRDRGIVIDEQNFRAVEFEVGFVLDGQTIPVRFPVVAPTFQQSTEIIPKAELDAALVQAQVINQQIAATAELPPELQTAQLNFDIQGINFQRTEDVDQDLTLSIPPIPALMVVAGNIGFLNQFFSVQIFTENAAPIGSGLSVRNVRAELLLPSGSDLVGSTNYSQPGDDPLRFARVGPDKIIQPIVPVVRPGQDGKAGTADDIDRLQPGEQGEGEFLVEGLQEGLHVMNLNLTADLEGLAAGIVKVNGKAAGSVLVRNPKFSMAFTHPRTVRFGEVYEAGVTILNTGTTEANQVNVRLGHASLSGAVLESEELVELGNLAPGQSATAKWRVRAQRTGAVSFSNLTTSDNSVQGAFRLRMGVDERGVVLSPDTLAMPDYVNALPEPVRAAATRVLGQALSVATAGQLPPGVRPVPKGIVTRRVLELAEAGQRLAYGDDTNRVLADLLLDWHGARNFNEGFDEVLRVTHAGREWREALFAAIELLDAQNATARLVGHAPDFAGRGENWKVAASSSPDLTLVLQNGGVTAGPDRSDLSHVAGYRGARGYWMVGPPDPGCVFLWKATNTIPSADLAVLLFDTNGTVRQIRWTIANIAAGACFRVPVTDASGQLAVDANGDGVFESAQAGVVSLVHEIAPAIVAARQDLTVKAGRPPKPCGGPAGIENYGTVIGVLFNKPMHQAQINRPSAFRLDSGVTAGSVQLQPGGRVALLNLKAPVSALVPRQLTVEALADPRGNLIVASTRPIESDVRQGAVVRGRVVRADGSAATGIPVTLTMHETDGSAIDDCTPYLVRVSQVFTDARGEFQFDFVLAGIPYAVSATDISGLPPAAITALLESTVDDQVSRARLQALLEVPETKDTLLAAFAVGAMPQAIAKAEGLDRAVLRDLIPENSARVGTEVPIALRFRGKATVTGQVLAADGVTPVSGAAVNLFPDPDSRLQGRGVFSDSSGRFAFLGVPLGVFTLNVQSPAGQFRTLIGEIIENGETKDFSVVLATNIVLRTALRGRVVEPDGLTPHGQARVLVGKYGGGGFGGVVALTRADGSGFWSVPDLPAGLYDVVAVSFDGKRKGDRRQVAADPGVVQYVTVALQGTAMVRGKVEFADGRAAPNALVAGGDMLVRTDGNGLFTLTGVPTGPRTISAGLQRDTNAGIFFTRLGSATVDVVPGADNTTVIRFPASGRIVGRVYDATGTNLVPNVRVSLPQAGGFQWVQANAQGFFAFENMPLGGYTVSAPAGPVAQTDTSGLIGRIRTGTEEQLLAALREAYEIFTGVADPYLNGQGATFNPLTWGYARTQLNFDGQTVVADVTFLRQGTIGGKVVNGQGVPIGARVRLTGAGPLANGAPGTLIRAEANSDPATGEFLFRNAVFEGSWEVQVASPFYPQVIRRTGISFPPSNLDRTNLVLAFPPVQEVNGRLVGNIFNPDGSPAGSNVNVRISFGDLTLRTVGDGFYDTQIQIPSGGYSVIATNEAGLVGIATVQVIAGITNTCNVRLQGLSSLEVFVRRANGDPASHAMFEVRQGNFPYETYSGQVDANGYVRLENVSEGCYAACASLVTGVTTIYGRGGAGAKVGMPGRIDVRLEPTGTIRGRFVRRDGVTPVDAAQVAIGGIGFAITDTNGFFEVGGLPLRTYRLITQNPVNGVGASAYVTLNFDGEIKNLVLIEQFRGEVRGYVINSYNTGYVPGAPVTLQVFDDLTPARTVTTGPDGAFSFPGTPAAGLQLTAVDPVSQQTGTKFATLAEGVTLLSVDVPLAPLGRLAGTVYQPDGVTPATNALVRITGGRVDKSANADTNGRVAFADLPFGSYQILARDIVAVSQHSAASLSYQVGQVGANPDFQMTLPGVGSISGTVLASDGLTPIPGAHVKLVYQSPLFYGQGEDTFSDFLGRYSFDDVPVGTYCLMAEFLVLGVNVTGTISRNGEADIVPMRLGSSGTVTGRLVRADGITPVGGAEIQLTFHSQSTVGGYAIARTGSDGSFMLPNIPIGPFALFAVASEVGGLAKLNSAVTFNLQTRDLGDIVLDEAPPFVESVFPPTGAGNVPVGTQPRLTFSEALDPQSIDALGIYFCSYAGMVEAIPILETTNGVPRVVRLVRRDNDGRLDSEATYDIIVLHKPYRGGAVPTDLVGRPLTTAFTSRFTTEDNRWPFVVSIFPSNNAVQIDPRAVLRVSFNEPVRGNGYVLTVTGPNGPVPGTANVGLNGLVVAFTPDQFLSPNARYTFSLSDARDLTGNKMQESVSATFATLDTVGPVINALRLADNRAPVAGATVALEALLEPDEPGASVRFTQDLQPAGVALMGSGGAYRVNVTLPAGGSTTLRAYASDVYGNEGPFAELVLNVVSNQPPTVLLTRATPPAGPVGSSRAFTIHLGAADDYTVTNLTLVAQGALSLVTNLMTGATQAVSLTVPATALAGDTFRLSAQAVDGLGVPSAVATLDLVVSDGTPPTVTLLSPAADALLNPSLPLVVTLASADNSAGHTLEVMMSGALAAQQASNVTAAANQSVGSSFQFDLTGVATNGTPLMLTVRGRDVAGNESVTTRSFRLPDSEPPQLVSVTPDHGAVGQSLWLDAVRLAFSEPIATNSATAAQFLLTNETGTATGYTVGLEADPSLVRLMPTDLPLPPGVTYSNVVLPPILDRAGNALVTSNQTAWPAEGVTFTFTTARVLGTSPAEGTPVVPGQTVAVSVGFEAGIGADFARFTLNTNPPVDVPVGLNSTNATGLVALDPAATTATLALALHKSGRAPYAIAPLTFTVRPRSADDDGDGWPNGFEADRGMNPFVLDADSADFDNDGLTNGDERVRGTDPARADTDGDTLLDGAEIAAGTNPLNADTDGDGLRDDTDPSPTHADTAPELVTPAIVYVQQGQPTNIVVSASDVDGNLRELRVASVMGVGARWAQLSKTEDAVVDAYFLKNNLTAGLISRWRGEGNADDFLGQNQGALRNGVSFAPGRFGKAFMLDGVDDYIQFPDGVANFRTTDFSIEFCFRTTSTQLGHIVTKRLSCDYGNFIEVRLSADGLLWFDMDEGASDTWTTIHSASPLNDGQFHHVAAVRAGIEMRMFIDGALAASANCPRILDINNTAPLRVGKSPCGNYDGLLDEFSIYNRALTANEIAVLSAGHAPDVAHRLQFGNWPVLPPAPVSQVYSNLLTAAPGMPPLTFALVAGTLPAGLQLSTDGRITGIPSLPGFAAFKVRVTDALGLTGEELFGLRVGIDSQLGFGATTLDGVVSWWRLEGDAQDWVGSNDGTLTGPASFVPLNGGVAFLPGGGHVRVPDAPALRPAHVTVSAWVKATSPGSYRYLVSKVRDGSFSSYALYTGGSGGLNFYVAGSAFVLSPDAGTAIWDGKLHHVAGSYDGSMVRLYVDGAEVGTGTPYGGGIGYSTALHGGDLFLGELWPSSGYGWPGIMDGVQLYQRALSAAEIRELAVPSDATGMVLAWPTNAPAMTAALTLNSYAAGTSTVQIIARDVTDKQTTNTVTVVATSDLDHDSLVDALDDDIDGDGLGNAQEVAAGTNPANGDSDWDDIPDHADPFPLSQNQRPYPGTFSAGGALRFDGLDDAVALDDNPALRQSSAITYMFWTRIPAGGGRYAIGSGAVNGNGYGGVYVRENFFGFYWTASSPLADAEIYALNPRIPTNEWVHLAVSVDFVQRTKALYVNGELVGSVVRNGANQVPGNWIPVGSYSAGQPDFIGGRFVNTMSYYTGELDEVQVWKTALTEAQVQAGMLFGAPTNDVNLVAYYRCDEGSGVTAVDSSRAARNATLGGGVPAAVPERLGSEARLFGPIPITASSPLTLSIDLTGTDPDGDPLAAVITRLPLHGRLYQTADGVTPGAAVTNAPAVVTNPQMRILHLRQAGYSGPDDFAFLVTDRYLQSTPRTVTLQLVTPPDLDSDGDGLPDVYEFQYGLNAELANADADFDGDGLTNAKERELGTRPDLDDTDGDLLRDGAEVATGTNPFNRDTDSDGLIDGSDPQPLDVVNGLVWAGPGVVTVRMGESTNITLLVEATNAPLAYVGWMVTNPPPTFVTMAPPALTNTAGYGAAAVTVGINPLHDAVTELEGTREYSFVVQAAAANGWSGTKRIRVIVEWEPSYRRITRWVAAVGGSWSDPTKWDNGVPGPDGFAVIEAVGPNPYWIGLDVDTACRGIVINSTNVTLQNWQGGQFNNYIHSVAGAVEIRRGTLRATPTIVDRGTPASGFIFNRPVFNGGQIEADPATLVPADTTNVWVDSAGNVFQGRSSLWIHGRRGSQVSYSNPDGARIATAGTISIGDWSPLSRTLTMLDGGALSGFLVHPIEIAGNVTASGAFGYTGAGAITGGGTIHFVGSSYVVGSVNVPVVIRRGARVAMNYDYCGSDCREGMLFAGRVEIEPGATYVLNPPRPDRGPTFAGQLINRGTIEMAGILGGQPGSRLENYGTITGFGDLGIPTRIHPEGEVHLSSGSVLRWVYPLEVAGRIRLDPGAAIWNSPGFNSPLVALPGAEFSGSGWIGHPSPEYSAYVTVLADATIPPTITLYSRLVDGSGQLTLMGNPPLQGTYQARVLLPPGAAGVLNGVCSIYNTIEISPGARLLRGSSTIMYLSPSGVVTNRGTISIPVSDSPYLIYSEVSNGGRIENAGLFEITRASGQPPGLGVSMTFAQFRVNPGGRLRVGEGTYFSMGTTNPVDVAGAVEVETNAALRLGGAWTGERSYGRLVARDGASFHGDGVLAVMPGQGGAYDIDVEGDATFAARMQFDGLNNPDIRVVGPGRMRLERVQELDLVAINSSLVLASNAVVTVLPRGWWRGQFQVNGPVTIESGAELRLLGDTPGFPQMGLNNTMRNAGRVVLGSGYAADQPRVIGSGRIENSGLVRIVREAPGPGRALVGVPIAVSVDGRLTVDPGARLAFTGGGLTLAGQLALGTGATLEHLAGTRLTLQAGNAMSGAGMLSFLGSGGLRLEADATLGQPLNLSSSFTADGTGRLRWVTDQVLSGTFQVPLVVGSGARVGVAPGTTLNNELQVEPGGTLEVGAGQPTLNLNQRLRNDGTVRLWSRTGADEERIRGTGWLDNEGLLEVTAVSSNAPGTAFVRVPVNVGSSGVLALRENALLGSPTGGVTNAGVLQVDGTALFTLQGDSSLVLQAGNELPGAGRVRFLQNAGLSVRGDSTAQWRLEFSSNSVAAGPATLSLANTQWLSGTFACPLLIAPGASVAVSNATFSSNVMVVADGWLDIPGGQRLQLDSVLTNDGAMTLASGNLASDIFTTGPGCVVNPGLFRMDAIGSGTNAAQLCVPLIVTPDGQLALGPGARLSVCDTAFLSVSGNVDTGPGSMLRLVEGSGRSLLALYAGATFTGSGEVLLEGDNRLLVLGRSTLAGGSLTMLDQSTAAGMGRLVVDGDGVLNVNHSLTLPGVLEVRGRLNVFGAPTTLRVGSSLLLASTGTIFNEGTILVGEFVNEGGTIIGTPPGSGEATPSPIAWIALCNFRMAADLAGLQVVFNWTAVPGNRFEVQASTNLVSWEPASATVREVAPGLFEARLPAQPGAARFFRVRQSSAGGL